MFNDNVSAYLAAIMGEARYKRTLADRAIEDRWLPDECRSDIFADCFSYYEAQFEEAARADAGSL